MVMWILSYCVVSAGIQGAPAVAVPFHLMEPGNDCVIAPGEETSGLRFASVQGEYSLIAPPEKGQDRPEWLESLRQYRERIRQGELQDTLVTLDYHGVRAWARLDVAASKVLEIVPEEAVVIEVTARRIEGNSTLCFAFDTHSTENDTKTGWTGVLASIEIPEDGEWHTVHATVLAPQFDPDREWLRPIIGFDATYDPAPGHVELSRIAIGTPDTERMASFQKLMEREPERLDFALYDRRDQAWLAHTFSCHFTFMYDKSFFDPDRDSYAVDAFLDDGEREFGGYDAVLLWHAYPRIGLDDRNQFDFYRDMPGGLEGLRDVVRRFHDRQVKVFINYNPWDRATRREEVSDEVALAEMVAALEADGIFLDTMFASSPGLRAEVDARRQGVVFVPEAHPKTEDLAELAGSWAQFPPNPFSPALLHHKWIEPRHMEFQIRRWNTLVPGTDHAEEIENAFFNGSGMMIWENIFGTSNPWRPEDRELWRRAHAILKAFSEHFTEGKWEPFYPTASPGIYAHRWQKDGISLFTLVNKNHPVIGAPLLSVPWEKGLYGFDLWSGIPCEITREADEAVVHGSVDKLGCILVGRGKEPPVLSALLRLQQSWVQSDSASDRPTSRPVIEAQPVTKTPAWTGAEAPEGMVFVPGTRFTMQVEHVRRECGCYPDPGTSPEEEREYLQGWDFSKPMQHSIGPLEVASFYIDETEVTNAQYEAFLDDTEYTPKHPENFLKHWPDSKMPPELAEHPVVYVDIDDARAYALWAGKRLPTEAEWHLAAQGTDGRKWPWGPEYDANRVNTSGATMPVRTLSDGRSPWGCYHMSGNVYELTESVRDDGHTRFLILRGGSFFDPNRNAETSSIWYFDGGPRPCDHHAKQILMWPGLDRCATVGFRCVKDSAAQ